jgi:glycosyltransferase involved in cell wall biosynthesis
MNNRNRRRVCIITGGHWAAVMGGAQFQAKCLVDELVKREGLEIFYLARRVNPDYQPEGYKIIKVAEPVGLHRYSFLFDAPQLLSALRKIEPDVIYQRGLQPYTGFAAYYARRSKCKFVFHIAHDYDVSLHKVNSFRWDSTLKFIERRTGIYGLKKADYIVAQTQHQRNLLEQNYGREAIAVVPNFHPLPLEEIKKKDSPIRVVWVANFKPTKRPEMFVKLAADFIELDNVEFIMIGRPGDPVRYTELHRRIGELPNLQYLGERPMNQVNELLAGAHLFVNTSAAEGFANTFIQAWMRRVPVVSAEVNSDGIFDDESVGVCGKTYEGLRDAVGRLIRDDLLREQIGANAYQYALRKHTVTGAEKLIRLIVGDSW